MRREEPRTLTLERTVADGRGNAKEYGTIICFLNRSAEAVVSQKKEQPKSCQKYDEIPWEILTVQKRCPHCRKPKDQKPQIHFFRSGGPAGNSGI